MGTPTLKIITCFILFAQTWVSATVTRPTTLKGMFLATAVTQQLITFLALKRMPYLHNTFMSLINLQCLVHFTDSAVSNGPY